MTPIRRLGVLAQCARLLETPDAADQRDDILARVVQCARGTGASRAIERVAADARITIDANAWTGSAARDFATRLREVICDRLVDVTNGDL